MGRNLKHMKNTFLLFITLIYCFFNMANAQSLSFGGDDDYVSLNSNLSATSGTWEAWIWKEEWGIYGDERLFGNGINYPDPNSLYISLHPSVGFHFRYGGQPDIDNVYVASLATTTLLSFTWHHLAATWDYDGTNTTLKIYLDGVLLSTATSPILITLSNSFYLGGNGDPAIPVFAGYMDEVHLWNTARTEAQIKNDMKCSFPPAQPGLITNYNFNEGIANGNNTSITYVNDISGNNNNGTLMNFEFTGGQTSNFTDDVNQVNPLPAITSISGISTTCAGDTITLTANGSATTFAWEVNSTLDTAISIDVNPTSTRFYALRASNVGCLVKDSIEITVRPLPSVSFNIIPGNYCLTDPSITLNASPSGGTFTGTGVTNDNFAPATSGIGVHLLKYTYTDLDNNCTNSDTAKVKVEDCTLNGIYEAYNENISVYPNPANEAFYIHIKETMNNATVQVYDLIGNKVLEESLSDNPSFLNFSTLNNAVYEVRVINNNMPIYHGKILKQK